MFVNQDQSSEISLAGEVTRLAEHREAVRNGRRRLLSTLGAAGAVAGAAALTSGLTGCNSTGQVVLPSTTPSVLDVLNFALNLEYLEASFYLYVTTGSGLSAADMGSSPGTVSGGAKVNFVNPIVASAANQLALDEREHVEFLRTTIAAVGGTPISMPNLNLAAGGPVTSDMTFLVAATRLEATGVSAYIGGAQYLVSSTAALTYAAQILDTEAQHEGLIRQLCINLGVTVPALDAKDKPPTATSIFNTGVVTGLSPIRTTSQVLQIVYAAPGMTGVSQGGFFPNGLNGNIITS